MLLQLRCLIHCTLVDWWQRRCGKSSVDDTCGAVACHVRCSSSVTSGNRCGSLVRVCVWLVSQPPRPVGRCEAKPGPEAGPASSGPPLWGCVCSSNSTFLTAMAEAMWTHVCAGGWAFLSETAGECKWCATHFTFHTLSLSHVREFTALIQIQ